MFLPVGSIEKYLYKVCTESLDAILADYIKEGDNNGKSLYRKLLQNLEKRNISEDTFIKQLSEIIMKYENLESFVKELSSRIGI